MAIGLATLIPAKSKQESEYNNWCRRIKWQQVIGHQVSNGSYFKSIHRMVDTITLAISKANQGWVAQNHWLVNI